MPGTRIVLGGGEPDPDPAPFLFLSAEHKAKNAAKPYDPKRSCWVPCKDDCWIEGLIEETSGAKVKVSLKRGGSVSISSLQSKSSDRYLIMKYDINSTNCYID